MIKKYLQQLLLMLLVLTILLTILIYSNNSFGKWFLLIPATVLFLGIGFVYPLQAIQHKPQTMFLWFGINMGVKMLVSAVFIITAIHFLNVSLFCFVGTYLLYYLSLLTFETLWLIKK